MGQQSQGTGTCGSMRMRPGKYTRVFFIDGIKSNDVTITVFQA